jgi:hypothetical protein
MLRAAVAAIVVAVLAVAAWADGGVYGPAIRVGQGVVKPVRTPDQRALLRFDAPAGTETLVIETTLQGDGTEFAWILPLPAAPKIEASTPGLFRSLEVLCGPDVCTEVPEWWLGIAWTGIVVAAIVRWRRGPYPALVAVFLIATPFALVCTAAGLPQMQGDGDDLTFGKYVAFGGGGPGVAPATVHVLSREAVGAYDTAVLSATDARDLRRWLDGNGFHAPETIDPVVAQYVAEGWVFVASRVRAPAADGVRRVHPLAFTFPAKDAAYPMRLTGATNDTLGLDLYVFSDREASAEGLEADVVVPFGTATDDGFDAAWTRHEEIVRRAANATVLSRLRGVLDGDAMHRDVRPAWVTPDFRRPLFFTAGAAASVALAAAALAASVGFVLGAIRARRAALGGTASDGARIAVRAACAVVAIFGIVFWTLPRLPPGGSVLDGAGDDLGRLLDSAPAFADVGAARSWFREHAPRHTNPYTGEPVREEDSPGNYVLAERAGVAEVQLLHPWGPSRTLQLSSFRRRAAVVSESGSVDIRPAPIATGRRVTVAGLVRDPRGAAVADAEVWIAAALDGPGRPDDAFLSDVGVSVQTDAAGRFSVEIPAGFVCDLGVVAPGRPRRLVEDVDLRGGSAAPIEIVVPDGVSVRGRVVDRAGRPVRTAAVELVGTRPFRMSADAGTMPVADDGSFELAGLPADSPAAEIVVHDHSVWDSCPKATFRLVPGEPSRDLVVDRP